LFQSLGVLNSSLITEPSAVADLNLPEFNGVYPGLGLVPDLWHVVYTDNTARSRIAQLV